MRRLAFIAIILLLWLSAAVRFHDLSRLPAGFNGEELDTLRVSETIRTGRLGVFYDVQKSVQAGREGLFPGLETLTTDLLGNGFLSYRILPSLAGLLAVALTFGTVRRLIGVIAGLVAAFAMAFGMLPLLLSRLIIAQSMLVPIGALLIWLIAQAVHVKRTGINPARSHTIPFTLIGLCLALAAYTHWIGLLLWLLYIIYALYLWQTQQPVSRRLLSYGGYALLVGLILSIPYVTTSIRVPDLSGVAAIWLQRPATVGMLLTNSRDLLVSLLGGNDISLLLLLPTVVLLVIGLITAIRRWRLPGVGLLLISFGIGLLPAVWTGRSDFNLVLAFPGTAALLGVGAQWLWDWVNKGGDQSASAQRRLLPVLAWGALLAVLLLAGVISLLFSQWPADPVQARQFHTNWGNLALYLDGDADPTPILICTENLTGSPDQPLSDPTLLQIMIHRDKSNLRFSDCRTAAVLADGGRAERVVFEVTRNASGRIQVPGALGRWLSPSTVFTLIPNTDQLAITTMNAEKSLADTIGRLALSPASWTLDTADKRDPAPLPVRMGDYLTFEGYSLDPQRHYKPGDFIYLTTFWRNDGVQQADIHVFAHIINNADQPPVIQNDMFDVLPTYLSRRDVVVQFQTIQVPYPFPGGLYWISIGAYHTQSLARVPMFDNNSDQPRSDRLFLGTIQIDG